MVLLLQLPLPPSFFQCPPMTSDMAESVKATAVHTTYDLVSKIQLRGGPNQYECVSDEHDLKIYKGLKDTIGPHGEAVPVYCAHMEVVATIDEVIALFHTEVTNPKAFCRRFGKGLLDAVTLYELESSLGPQNRITVTWRAYDSQLPSVVRRRDVCAVEFTLGGRRGWVRAFKSIELPCCPGLETHMGLVRMANYGSGHVFVESELRPGYLDMYFVTQVDYCEGKSEWLLTDVLRCKKLLAKVITKKRCRSLLDIDRFLREDRLRQLPAVPMDPTYRHHCFMCTKRLMPIVKRTACHTCGHVLPTNILDHIDPPTFSTTLMHQHFLAHKCRIGVLPEMHPKLARAC
ncbi:hypothetical protein DYB25_009556 [Aphanomyces astaci]|uniref:START domain-containing protein n=1 Tax=Aphanomyces astaci TaxID=112090 RepID=A0A396ZP18_APHAT|nr:hypothetical protein DYB36_007317 [Aphanomyces astaci]RHY00952.1 hypothetical protein DYB25_009556 [Aphanomyces astaci]RHY39706.1 hypothetical protein DYB38_003209 [Aphanomyces astaci]RHZ12040.1 hypothetical protein DYB31_005135 [Aphanomyces astaci]